MVNKCSVPNCKGNYNKHEKVSVFKFPEDESLKMKWITVLKRKDFVPTKNSRVCVKHFNNEDIIRETTYFNEKTGELLRAPLDRPRLKDGAVPIPPIPPDIPNYSLEETTASIEDGYSRCERIYEDLHQAIVASQESYSINLEENSFNDFDGFLVVLEENNHLIDPSWSIIKQKDVVLFCILKNDPIPNIKLSVMVEANCNVRVFHYVELKELNKTLKLPFCLQNINDLDEILTSALKLYNNNDNSSNLLQYFVDITEHILLNQVMKLVTTEQGKCIKFLLEQFQVVIFGKRRKT